ncbi:signal peptidase 22 kDa subunit [Microthyrium microscopicum]|uniref:Signal peptidase subunit 3 n=1 Tax=Microthyrium microscopicum TaxID=703497 RepID=A0A6A6URZ1_9PEZI|nr:signal peptidase 22 kDa subunit [Microthyrium microscopicum]
MHSALVRVQNTFGFFTTVASFVAFFIALSAIVTPQTPKADLTLRNVQVARGRPHYYSSKHEEYAHIRFNLDMDLRSLFTWNTKQVFAYVTATYPSTSPNEPPSRAIIWDAILPGKLEPWHQNQYIHPGPPPIPKGRRRAPPAGRIYALKETPGKLRLKGQKPKYVITDHTGKISSRSNVTLELGFNVQPWVGALLWSRPFDLGMWKTTEGGKSEAFDFPAIKGEKPPGLDTVRGGEGNRGKPA